MLHELALCLFYYSLEQFLLNFPINLFILNTILFVFLKCMTSLDWKKLMQELDMYDSKESPVNHWLYLTRCYELWCTFWWKNNYTWCGFPTSSTDCKKKIPVQKLFLSAWIIYPLESLWNSSSVDQHECSNWRHREFFKMAAADCWEPYAWSWTIIFFILFHLGKVFFEDVADFDTDVQSRFTMSIQSDEGNRIDVKIFSILEIN